MSLLTLPLEIQLEILSYSLNQDIVSLSISCRTLQSLCDLEIRKKFHQIIIQCDDKSRNAAFDFLMAILRRPYLGNYVHHIECRDPTSDLEIYPERTHQRDLSQKDLDLVQVAVGKAGFTGSKQDQLLNMLMQKTAANTIRKEGKENEEHGDAHDNDQRKSREWKARGSFTSQALAAIIISVSPNLISLAMIDPKGGRYDDSSAKWPLYQLLCQTKADPTNKHFLRNLRKVHIIGSGTKKWDRELLDDILETDLISDLRDFTHCFHLFDSFLSIESISAEGLNQNGDLWPMITEQTAIANRSNVSRFSFPFSLVETPLLAAMISTCKVLREFQYSNGGQGNRWGYLSFNIKGFIKGICPHKKTLEVLDLDVDHVCNLSFRPLEENTLDLKGGPLDPYDFEPNLGYCRLLWKNSGSLKDFVALRRLSMGIQTLLYFAKGVKEGMGENGDVMLAECLPDNMSYLCIRGYERGKNSEWDGQMDALKAFYDSGLSNLSQISGIDESIPNTPAKRPQY